MELELEPINEELERSARDGAADRFERLLSERRRLLNLPPAGGSRAWRDARLAACEACDRRCLALLRERLEALSEGIETVMRSRSLLRAARVRFAADGSGRIVNGLG